MHREASDFLRALHGAGRSPHTICVYAGRVANFLGWCAGQGVEWSSISLASLARLKHFVEATPGRGGRLRSGATVNATLTAVCEFLRFCARTGLIEMVVAERLSEPRWLRFTPPGFDRAAWVRVSGPLAEHAEGFRAMLGGRGCAPSLAAGSNDQNLWMCSGKGVPSRRMI
jgi:site-specific recombinase XerC